MKKRLAIFDFDGTLFDTVPANAAAYAHALAKHGVQLDEEYFAMHCNGRYYRDFLPPLLGGDEALVQQVHRDKIACFPSFYQLVRENRPLFALLETLQPTYHIALVSTASRQGVMDILRQFGRLSLFELILTQQDVPQKKPAPDGFLAAMTHFGISAADTIVFEDSPEGIEAAHRAGAQCFAVPCIEAAPPCAAD